MSDTPSFIKFSVTDILKKGIGSSSSHTLAPWRSAQACYSTLQTGNWLGRSAPDNLSGRFRQL